MTRYRETLLYSPEKLTQWPAVCVGSPRLVTSLPSYENLLMQCPLRLLLIFRLGRPTIHLQFSSPIEILHRIYYWQKKKLNYVKRSWVDVDSHLCTLQPTTEYSPEINPLSERWPDVSKPATYFFDVVVFPYYIRH